MNQHSAAQHSNRSTEQHSTAQRSAHVNDEHDGCITAQGYSPKAPAAAAAAAAAAAEAAARRRAGEVLRLSMQFINLFALKAGVQALAPALLWLGCGAISLASAAAATAAAAGTRGGGAG